MTHQEPKQTEPTKDIDKIKEPSVVEKWARPTSGLEQRFDGVHLGRIGNSHNFKDESRTPVPEAGIVFNVVQNSAGMTGIYAEPLQDNTVEALELDKKTHQLKWNATHPSSRSVLVSGDWGELVKDEPVDWTNGGNFGIEGPLGGIVRVTDKNGDVRYFFLGADFKGVSDDWTVTGGIVEVQPTDISAIPTNLPAEQLSVQQSPVGETETPSAIVDDTVEVSENPYASLFRFDAALGQIATKSSSEPEDDVNEDEIARDAALRERKPQPPLTEADIARLTKSRGKRPTDEDIAGMNAARARGIHN